MLKQVVNRWRLLLPLALRGAKQYVQAMAKFLVAAKESQLFRQGLEPQRIIC